MSTTMWVFLIVTALMTLSGALSIIRKRKTPEDYLIASRNVAPWLAALSAVATNNSGFMFIGMIAYTYRLGIESIWMMFGWIVGDFIAWVYVYPRARETSERVRVNTLSRMIGTRSSAVNRPVIVAAGLITFVFLGVYAAGQLKAGSTALYALFGWDMQVGALIGAAIVIVYSYAGGIRADIWTDAAQSLVMIVSMVSIVVAGVMEIGGPGALLENLRGQDPALIEIFPQQLEFGVAPYVLGFLAAGFAVIGQPHLMTRIMAIQSPQAIRTARFYYFLWFIPFFIASIAVGLYSRAVLPELSQLSVTQELSEPTELALPVVTMQLLPEIFVGIALAGLFAATVSTADSQIIVCSGVLTQDVQPRWEKSYLASKIGTFSVTALALSIALFAPEGVFTLVLIAWSALGASLGPVLLVRLWRQSLPAGVALTMMIAGLGTVAAWQLSGYDDDMFKMLPGMIAAVAVYALYRLVGATVRCMHNR